MIMINYSTLRSRVCMLLIFFVFFRLKSEGERCTTWTPHLHLDGQQVGKSRWGRDC